MNDSQKQITTTAQENPAHVWRSLCLDWLEAHTLDCTDGINECVQATIDALRNERQTVVMLPPAQFYQAPAVIQTDATPKPDQNPTETIPPDGFKTKAGAAGAAHLKAWRERKKAEAEAEKASPEPEPVPQNGASPIPALIARQEQCISEIRQMLDTDGHIKPATEHALAQKHNLSLHGVEQLVADVVHGWLKDQDRAARREEKAAAEVST